MWRRLSMKKRVAAFVLFVVMLFTMSCFSASAVDTGQGRVVISTGRADLDHMALEILKEIELDGLEPVEQIRAVYDWIIYHCERYEWDGTYYFDKQDVADKAGVYADTLEKKIKDKEVVVRKDLYSDEFPGNKDESGAFLRSMDQNSIMYKYAEDIMYKRYGTCIGYSSLFAVLLGQLGYDARIVEGDFLNSNGSIVIHKWNYVLIDGKYYWFDVRIDHANYARNGKIDYTYFMKESTEEWEKKHAWDHAYSNWLAANAQQIQQSYLSEGKVLFTTPSAPAPAPDEELGHEIGELPDSADSPDGRMAWENCSAWAVTYMKNAYGMNIVPDSLDGVDLTKPIDRAEAAGVAVKLFEALSGNKNYNYIRQSPFKDTEETDVLKAYTLGLVKGTSDDRFSPDQPLTREQAATMLGRVCELVMHQRISDGTKLADGFNLNFADNTEIHDWRKNYICFFVRNNIINGVGNNRFAPADPMTREAELKISSETVVRMNM